MKPCDFQALLSFFSARVLHKGPRLLLQLIVGSTLILATLLVISRGFGEELSSNDLFRWSENQSDDIKDEKAHYEFQSQQQPGGLRVVVFGEDDVATPAWTRGEKEMRSPGWTELMCRELNCSHYLSFIPPNLHPPAHPLISNDIYVEAVRQTIKNTTKLKKSQGPGYDYTFQPRLFPVSKALPDLSAQVTAFLELQNTTTLPKANETLWVFNLGQWDVWSLATLPIATGKAVIDQLTDHVIEQMERLYESTVTNDATAVSANSNHLSRKTNADPIKIIDPEVYKTNSGVATDPTSGSAQKAKTQNSSSKPETFRVFFPSLFDISMAPGWNSNRPETPHPHSKAEQMRNAAKLADTWNQVMGDKLYAWVDRSDVIAPDEFYLDADKAADTSLDGQNSEEEEEEEEEDGNGTKRSPTSGKKKTTTRSAENDVVNPNTITNTNMNPKPKKQPPPVRDFITYDMVDYITSALIEGQLRSSGLSDGNGLGQKPMNNWYKEVWEPCVKPVKSETELVVDLEDEGLVMQQSTTNSTTNSTDSQTETETATELMKAFAEAAAAAAAAEAASDQAKEAGVESKRRTTRRTTRRRTQEVTTTPEVEAEGAAAAEEVREEAGEERTETVCNVPDDYLFYTPFTLGSRAIREIAREAAEKVKRGESYRTEEDGKDDEGLWASVQGHQT
ncbi:hypothetical protein GE21DRAFT_3651 [Neurospora crassa]|uniref:Uncharacterized protein n=2 Tax=Neurospora crassa TaxID=5141 RepID=F5HCG8_NEUCR|nr:hypothetical protein NCU10245 [Neurospora crassa OR74A]EAA33948.2 hypothetical protein NCU10245 [Neurospora crassa OR74A]KHE82409.1 hypothetical protein GE21DRAFT_3651 [Neurospora crassa]CAD70527.1 conserved hypothetical protein [Neurospora crassa]|eukprot:XP_963184.2 hypothetical protein NCU10245 [Neurospora crassa OR74A]